MEIQQDISFAKNQEKIGKTLKVLFDRKEGEYFVGRTEFDSPEVDNEVILPQTEGIKVGDMVVAKINSADFYELNGEFMHQFA